MNAFFQVVSGENNTKLRLVPATDSGNGLNVMEISNYLSMHKINHDMKIINQAVQTLREETTIVLNNTRCLPISESVSIEIEAGNMRATARFIPQSDNGQPMNENDIMQALQLKGIRYGIKEDIIRNHIQNPVYLTDIIIAEGVEPIQGHDAEIEYFFNTDQKARPTLLEDGSVDFFHLNIINHCNKGDLLARLYPEDPGQDGFDIMGSRIKPFPVKHKTLRFGRNITASEDRTEIYAQENGHVTLVDEQVFVSNLMEVENVDTSTGDIEFEGNVQINGNVCSNFKVHAKGNIEIRGVVEGAEVIAGGNITIARGVNGMGKGFLKCDGNLISKFIENSTIEAEGYVEAGSIMHSNVMAGTEIHVSGKRGFISGGHVSATSAIDVKILGSEMGTDTVIEIGVSPMLKKKYKDLCEEITNDQKTIERAVPILEAARDKFQAGKELSEAQIENIRELSNVVRTKKEALKSNMKEVEYLEELLDVAKEAQVIVRDTVYPGTKIVISDVSKIIKETMKYCRFVRMKGDVTMVGM